MTLLSSEDLRQLATPRAGPCITITLPTHRDPAHGAQDALQLRSLLEEVERQLSVGGPDRERLLAPLRDLIEEREFWRHQDQGLALFRAPDLLALHRLPGPLPATASANDRFRLRPLLPFLRAGRRYLLLTLAQNHVALWEGDLTSLRPVDLPPLPRSLHEALGEEWRLRYLGAHSQGHGALVFHGHGAPSEDTKEDVTRFFRHVDEGLWPYLRDQERPLILAGVEYYHPLFRQITRYRHLAEEGLTGNVERDAPAQLLEKVRPLAERLAHAREAEVLKELDRAGRSGRAARDLRAIARAAVQGRVHTLLQAEGATVSGGCLDPASGDVREGEGDLLEELSEAVLLRAGAVRSLPAGRLPDGLPCLARLRW